LILNLVVFVGKSMNATAHFGHDAIGNDLILKFVQRLGIQVM